MSDDYSLRVVYETEPSTTLVLEKSTLSEVIKKAEEISASHGDDSIGFYIKRVKD